MSLEHGEQPQSHIPEQILQLQLTADAMITLQQYGYTAFCEYPIPPHDRRWVEQWVPMKVTGSVPVNNRQLRLSTTFCLNRHGHLEPSGVVIQEVSCPGEEFQYTDNLFTLDPVEGVCTYLSRQEPRVTNPLELQEVKKILDVIDSSLEKKFGKGKEIMEQAQAVLQKDYSNTVIRTNTFYLEGRPIQKDINVLVTPAVETELNDQEVMSYLTETVTNDPECPIDLNTLSIFIVYGTGREATESEIRLHQDGRITDEYGNPASDTQIDHVTKLLSLMESSFEA